MLIAIFILTIAGVGLGVWAKLAPYWPEVGIALSFLLVIVAYGIYSIANICGNEIALEYYHFVSNTWELSLLFLCSSEIKELTLIAPLL